MLELALLLKSDDFVFHRVLTTLHFKQFCKVCRRPIHVYAITRKTLKLDMIAVGC